jgi:hypothetical protein
MLQLSYPSKFALWAMVGFLCLASTAWGLDAGGFQINDWVIAIILLDLAVIVLAIALSVIAFGASFIDA